MVASSMGGYIFHVYSMLQRNLVVGLHQQCYDLNLFSFIEKSDCWCETVLIKLLALLLHPLDQHSSWVCLIVRWWLCFSTTLCIIKFICWRVQPFHCLSVQSPWNCWWEMTKIIVIHLRDKLIAFLSLWLMSPSVNDLNVVSKVECWYVFLRLYKRRQLWIWKYFIRLNTYYSIISCRSK